MKELKFLVFADLHYKKRMYAATVAHLGQMLQRAETEACDLILHAGDFCNDYAGSPELLNAWMQCRLPVFGAYGNHELESKGNSMQSVSPYLTNRPKDAVWGSADGLIGDGSIGYYFYDIDGFRLIFTDTNYSLKPDGVTYEHNRTASWGMPEENTQGEALGQEQRAWLEQVLPDAADRDLRCIVISHSTFLSWGEWGESADAAAVRDLFDRFNRKKPGTVLMSINGHYHTNHVQMRNGVLFFDVNAVVNGWWQGEKFDPYNAADVGECTFDFVDYDAEGRQIDREQMPLSALRMGAQTLFFAKPLSAVVTVTSEGEISVCGSESSWMYGIAPKHAPDGVEPRISDFSSV